MQKGNGTYLSEIGILLLRFKCKERLDEHEEGDKDNVCSCLLISELESVNLVALPEIIL